MTMTHPKWLQSVVISRKMYHNIFTCVCKCWTSIFRKFLLIFFLYILLTIHKHLMNDFQYQVMSINVPFTFGSFLPFSSILETKLVKYGQLRHYSWLFYMYSSFSDRKINNFTYFLPNRIYYQWDFYLDERKKMV